MASRERTSLLCFSVLLMVIPDYGAALAPPAAEAGPGPALASLPGFTLPGDISATERYYADDITAERFALNADSTIDVPTGPGLGVTVDRRALAQFMLASLEIRE